MMLFCCFCTSLKAQDPHYFHYDTENGLPSSESYSVLEDKQGYIWITTDRGVVRYDGYEFKTYTTENGLPTNTNFTLQYDDFGRIWLASLNGAISYFDGNAFRNPAISDSIQKLNSNGTAKGLFHLENGDYLLVLNKYYNNINFNAFKLNLLEFDHMDTFLKKLPQAFAVHGNHITETRLKSADGFPIHPKVKVFAAHNKKALLWIANYGCETGLISDSNVIYFHSPRQLFRWDLRSNRLESTPVFEHIYVQAIYFDQRSGDLFVCTKTGLLRYRNGKINSPPQTYFRDFNFTGCTRDREGNYWLTTLNKGLMRVPDLNLTIAESDKSVLNTRILSLVAYRNQLLAGGSDGTMSALDDKGHIHQVFKDNTSGRSSLPIENIVTMGDTVWTSYGFFFLHRNGQFQRQPQLFYGAKFIFRTNYGSYVHGMHNIYTAEEFWDPEHRKVVHLNYRLYSVNQEKNGVLWLGTSSGLYKKIGPEIIPVSPVLEGKELLTGRISDIKITPSQKVIVFATRNYGITLFDQRHFFHFGIKQGLVSDQINRVFVENDSVFWLCTNKGVNRLTIGHKKDIIFAKSVYLFNSLQGLPSNFVNDVAVFNGRYWFATDKGLVGIQQTELVYTTLPPKISRMVIETGDSVYTNTTREIILNPDNNDLEIQFTAISFRKPDGDAFYRYTLTGKDLDTTWRYTNQQSVRLLNLAPANYVFRLQARNNNNLWSETRVLKFTILPRFTQTIWFWILLSLALLTVAVLVFFIWYRNQKNKTDLEKRIQKSDLSRKAAELDALRNQMNPHFVYNSLNSIQSFIYSGDFKKANDFIVRFSSLMRNSLQYSRLEFIPLSQELEFIENYLYLEESRFSGKFKYRVNVSGEIIQENISVPPLMIQPLLENAVKHAFKGVQREGLITVSVEPLSNTNSLQITIADNGVGMDSESGHEDNSHTSLGLEIIQRRIELLKEKYPDSPVSMQISSSPDNLEGTKIVLVLPFESIWEN